MLRYPSGSPDGLKGDHEAGTVEIRTERSLRKTASGFTLGRTGPWLLRLGGLIVFPILVWFGIDFADVGRSLREARIELVIAALALRQAAVLLGVWRWRMLAEAVGIRYPRFRDYLFLSYLGLFAGLALPQTAASFTPALFMTEDGHPWQRSVGSIVLDRTVEVLVTLLFAVGAAIYLFPVVPLLSISFITAGGSIFLALGGAYVWRRQLGRVAEALRARYPLLKRWSDGLQVPGLARALYDERARLGRAAVLGVLIAFLNTAFVVMAAAALGIGASWVFIAMAWGVAAPVIMLPISVLGLGPREGMFVLLFTAAGEPREEALALGLLLFVLGLVVRAPSIIVWATRRAKVAPTPTSGDEAL